MIFQKAGFFFGQIIHSSSPTPGASGGKQSVGTATSLSWCRPTEASVPGSDPPHQCLLFTDTHASCVCGEEQGCARVGHWSSDSLTGWKRVSPGGYGAGPRQRDTEVLGQRGNSGLQRGAEICFVWAVATVENPKISSSSYILFFLVHFLGVECSVVTHSTDIQWLAS